MNALNIKEIDGNGIGEGNGEGNGEEERQDTRGGPSNPPQAGDKQEQGDGAYLSAKAGLNNVKEPGNGHRNVIEMGPSPGKQPVRQRTQAAVFFLRSSI